MPRVMAARASGSPGARFSPLDARSRCSADRVSPGGKGGLSTSLPPLAILQTRPVRVARIGLVPRGRSGACGRDHPHTTNRWRTWIICYSERRWQDGDFLNIWLGTSSTAARDTVMSHAAADGGPVPPHLSSQPPTRPRPCARVASRAVSGIHFFSKRTKRWWAQYFFNHPGDCSRKLYFITCRSIAGARPLK